MVLPFPFDQVENFFRDLFNSISAAISNIVSNVISGLSSAFSSLSTIITNTAASIKTAFFSTMTLFKDQILGALSGVPGKVAGLLGGIEAAIAPFLNQIKSTVQNLINSALQVINNVVIPGIQNIYNFVTSIPGVIYNRLQPIISHTSQQLQNAFSSTAKFIQNLPGQIWNQITQFGSDLSLQFQNGFNKLVQDTNNLFIVSSSNLQGTQDLISGFNQFAFQAGQNFEKLGKDIASSTIGFFDVIKTAFNGIWDDHILPFLQAPQQLADKIISVIHPTGSITPDEARNQMNIAGAAAIAGMTASAAAGLVIEGFTFGQVDISLQVINDAMNNIGVSTFARDLVTFEYVEGVRPAARRQVLRKYEPNIPGPGDLVNMVVKEAFVPELRTPAPEIFADNMRENGFTRFWSDTFWTAHWVPIDLDRITEMFHRGIITEADFIRRLIILDFRPDDTELVKEVLFKLPNRVEARLMARFGLLTDAQLDEIIKAEGVREDFVPALRTMMQDFALTSIFSKTETEAITSYENGLINEDEVRHMLTSIKRPPNVINSDVNLVKFKRETKFRDLQVKAVVSAMKKGTISINTAETRLQSIGVDSEFIGFIIAEQNWILSVAVSAKTKSAAKDLTVAQLTKAVKEGHISVEDTLNALTAKGYDADEARVLMQISGAITA
jgi:hypothetical protein